MLERKDSIVSYVNLVQGALMSLKKVIVSSAAALAILSGTANAAVELQNDGTGDYLLYPATYSTESGSWKTELKIVNTNVTHAVVARVVVRNGEDSSELFDFPVYLTPGDVWVGTLQVGEEDGHTGQVVVKTSDDSSMLWAGAAGKIVSAKIDGPLELTVPSDDAKFGVPNSTTGTTTGRTSTYVEVFGLAAYDATDIAAGWTINTPLNKEAFFEYSRNVTNGIPKTQIANPGPLNDLYGNVVDVESSALLGKQVIVNDAAKLNMAYNAVALSEVSAAAMTTAVIGTETKLSTMSSKGALLASTEMQVALSKDLIYVMNEGVVDGNTTTANPMRIHFTDPMKKYHEEANRLPVYYTNDTMGNLITNWYYEYNQMARDMEENPAMCNESGGNTDFSNDGFGTSECEPKKVNVEVKQINNSDFDPVLGDYIFESGGYLTYKMLDNTAVVPTTFSSSTLSGSAVNYHIGNQYKATK